MNLQKLKQLVKKSINKSPPIELFKYCNGYYEPYYYLAYLLSEHYLTGTFVELGVEKGRFLKALALGSEFAEIIGMDTTIRPEIDNLVKSHKNVIVINKPSLPVIMYLEKKEISILHIDTEHSYSMANAEFEAYRPYLADGATVCFDDLHATNNGVMKYFNELEYEKIENDLLHSCGYGVLIYRREDVEGD